MKAHISHTAKVFLIIAFAFCFLSEAICEAPAHTYFQLGNFLRAVDENGQTLGRYKIVHITGYVYVTNPNILNIIYDMEDGHAIYETWFFTTHYYVQMKNSTIEFAILDENGNDTFWRIFGSNDANDNLYQSDPYYVGPGNPGQPPVDTGILGGHKPDLEP